MVPDLAMGQARWWAPPAGWVSALQPDQIQKLKVHPSLLITHMYPQASWQPPEQLNGNEINPAALPIHAVQFMPPKRRRVGGLHALREHGLRQLLLACALDYERIILELSYLHMGRRSSSPSLLGLPSFSPDLGAILGVDAPESLRRC